MSEQGTNSSLPYAGKARRILIKTAAAASSAIFWIAVWAAAAYGAGSSLILPSPAETFGRLLSLLGEGDFWLTTFKSLLRITAGTFAGAAAGVLCAALSYSARPAETLMKPAVTVIRATPVASFIIIAMLWIGRGNLPSFISFLMVFPIIYTNTLTGLREVGDDEKNTAALFELTVPGKLRYVYFPAVKPYFLAAVKTATGLSWKAGIAAEVLAFSPDSIGRKLSESKNYLETVDLFAWTAVVVILSLLFEILFERIGRYLSVSGRRIRKLENELKASENVESYGGGAS